MKLTANVRIDRERLARKLQSDALWLHAAKEWHRLYQPYVPRDTGRLYRDVRIAPGQIEHLAPYAARIYYGTSKMPGRQWDAAAIGAQRAALVAAVQAYVDSGRLNLGG